MKTKTLDGEKYKVKKELGQLFNMYANNFGIRLTELEDGKVLFQKVKLGKTVPGHYSIRHKSELEELEETPEYLHYATLLEENIALIPEEF